jgi:hypothetical protein
MKIIIDAPTPELKEAMEKRIAQWSQQAENQGVEVQIEEKENETIHR